MPILFLIIFLDVAGFGILLPSIMFVLDNMGAGPAFSTVIVASYSAGQFVSGPFWGRLSDRVGRKPVLIISLVGALIAYLMMVQAETPFWIFLSRLIAGLMAGNIAVAYAAVADLTTMENRAKGMGILGAAFGVGFVLGPAIGGLLGGDSPETATIVYPAMASAVLASLGIIVTLLFFKESLSDEHKAELANQPQVNRFDSMRKVARRPVLAQMCLMALVFTTTAALMEPVMPLILGDRYSWGPDEMGWLFVYVGLLVAIIQGGLIGKLVKTFGEKKLVFIAYIMMFIGLAIIIYTPVWGGILVAMSLTGASTAFFNTSMLAMASHRAGNTERGLVMGVFQSMQALGRTLGPMMAGALYAMWEGMPMATGMGLMIITLIWMAALAARMTSEETEEEEGKDNA